MTTGLIPEEPSKRLYAEVFEDKPPESITATLADGIRSVIGNVERILTDVDYLRADGRIAPASFLLATADEEFAKIFILIDACRLDPVKHASTLRCLCGAFYNHIQKYAYNAVRRYHPIIESMDKASLFWSLEVKRWRPAPPDPQSGEPAMPHDIVFDREMPLYVDWDYYSKKWMLPDNSINAWKFGSEHEQSHLERLRTEFAQMKVAANSNLLAPGALMLINEVWRGTYVSDNTSTTAFHRMKGQLVRRLVTEQKVSEDDLGVSPLFNWPLYHFTTT